MPTYDLLATEVPAVNVPSGWITPDGEAPEIIEALLIGDAAIDSVPVWHRWAKTIEALGRMGGGARAISQGLLLETDASLALPVTAGQAWADIPIGFDADTTVAVTDDIHDAGDYAGERIFVWLTQGNTLQPVNNSLTAPSPDAVFLGSCRTLDGAVVDTDRSGVMIKLQGGILFRRTGDPGPPGDTPPSNVSFLAQTDGGYYWWTGSAYVALLDAQTVKTDGTHSTSGPLADVVTAGTGISLAVVDTGGGVWKLQITNTDPGSTYAVHVEELPTFDVDVPSGETRYVEVDFSERGSFPAEGNYTVLVDAVTGGTTSRLVVEEVQTAISGGADLASKGGGVCVLRLRNITQPLLNLTNDTFTLTVTLVGPDWTEGSDAEADPAITELDLKETYVQYVPLDPIECPPGEARVVKVDLSELGSYGGEFLVRASCDQDPTKTLISRLVGYQDGEATAAGFADGNNLVTPDTFAPSFAIVYLLVQNAADAEAGDYGTSTQLELTLRCEGPRWRAHPTGTGVPAVDVYPYDSGFDPADYATEAYVDAATADLIKADGTRDFTGDQSMDGNRLTDLPDTPTAGADAVNQNYVDAAIATAIGGQRIAPLARWEDVAPTTRNTTPQSLILPLSASVGAVALSEWLCPGDGAARRISILCNTTLLSGTGAYRAAVYQNGSPVTSQWLDLETADGRQKVGELNLAFAAGDLLQVFVTVPGTLTVSGGYVVVELSGYVEDH
jgi:hypothetical protein